MTRYDDWKTGGDNPLNLSRDSERARDDLHQIVKASVPDRGYLATGFVIAADTEDGRDHDIVEVHARIALRVDGATEGASAARDLVGVLREWARDIEDEAERAEK